MDIDDLRARVASLGQATKCVSKAEVAEIHKLNLCASKVLQLRADNMIAEHGDGTIIQIYMNDGWTGRIMSKIRDSDENANVIERHNKTRVEFLLQHKFLRFKTADGKTMMTFVPDQPRPMTMGKTGWNVWTAAVESCGLLREKGATGICVGVYILDGALFSAVARHLRSYHALAYRPEMGMLGDGFNDLDREVSVLLDVLVTVRLEALDNAVLYRVSLTIHVQNPI